jgi:hypothetical protein
MQVEATDLLEAKREVDQREKDYQKKNLALISAQDSPLQALYKIYES